MEEFLDPYFFHQTQYGKFFLRKGDNSANLIVKNLVYEPHITAIFRSLVKEGDSVIDLGANIGYHTIELSRLVGPTGRVLALEPLKEVFFHLSANLFLNRCFNVSTLNKVCTDVSNQVVVMEEIDWGNSGNSRIKRVADEVAHDMVYSIALDDIDTDNVTLVKIDVQGSESNVLKGAKYLLNEVRPYFVVEVEEHHLLEFKSSSKDLLNQFIDHDYILYRINNQYPCDHVAVPKELPAIDFKEITGYDITIIDKPVKDVTMRWPLYDKAIL